MGVINELRTLTVLVYGLVGVKTHPFASSNDRWYKIVHLWSGAPFIPPCFDPQHCCTFLESNSCFSKSEVIKNKILMSEEKGQLG